jgi:hypothetical protein
MWRYLLILALLLCLIGLVGCAGNGLGLGGNNSTSTIAPGNSGTITPPTQSGGSGGGPPSPPY